MDEIKSINVFLSPNSFANVEFLIATIIIFLKMQNWQPPEESLGVHKALRFTGESKRKNMYRW